MPTDPNELAREMREAASKATMGPWESVRHTMQLSPLGVDKGIKPFDVALVKTTWIHGQAKDKLGIAMCCYSPYTLPHHHEMFHAKDADHIAASNPVNVLAILDDRDRLLAERERMLAFRNQPNRLVQHDHAPGATYSNCIGCIADERDRLLAKLELVAGNLLSCRIKRAEDAACSADAHFDEALEACAEFLPGDAGDAGCSTEAGQMRTAIWTTHRAIEKENVGLRAKLADAEREAAGYQRALNLAHEQEGRTVMALIQGDSEVRVYGPNAEAEERFGETFASWLKLLQVVGDDLRGDEDDKERDHLMALLRRVVKSCIVEQPLLAEIEAVVPWVEP